ncbi:hypothetical protein [Enterobacter ludwigii]
MWQGIPFKFMPSDLLESSNLIIEKIPHIFVDTSPDYIGAIATATGTLVAGCLSAFVAWYAIKANRKQMLQQQMIIDKQTFTNELRTRMSTFLADLEKLSVMLKPDISGRQLSIANMTFENRASLEKLAYDLDLSRYHLLLMIDNKSQFAKVRSLIDKVTEDIELSIRNVMYYGTDEVTKELIKATVSCIDSEWKLVTKLSK